MLKSEIMKMIKDLPDDAEIKDINFGKSEEKKEEPPKQESPVNNDSKVSLSFSELLRLFEAVKDKQNSSNKVEEKEDYDEEVFI